MRVCLPDNIRCAIALSYDLEMCAGYQPDGVNHGRIIPEVQDYTLSLCDVAETFGTKLHFFHVGNGFEETLGCLRQIHDRGHHLDNHTLTHLPLLTDEVEKLDDELATVNRLFEERLGFRSTVLRGPGGYQNGLDGKPENQEVILKNGFRWVSCRFDGSDLLNVEHVIRSPEEDGPYAYPTGLIEIPIHGYTDRSFFDNIHCTDPDAYQEWRTVDGGRAMPPEWRAPWPSPTALDDWIEFNHRAIDYVYENRLLWVPTWHPMTHYLHDRDNVALRDFLAYCASKNEKAWVCTVRDAADLLGT